MSRSVSTDQKLLRWFIVQARTRALLLWAADPRREAQVPGLGMDMIPVFEPLTSVRTSVVHSVDAGVHTELEADGQTVRVVVHIKPYMLHPDWDVPAHSKTWLLELVDGAAGGSMQTIPRPTAETLPPGKLAIYPRDKIHIPDPAGGMPLPYFLRDLDPVNGIARYTSDQRITCPTCGSASSDATDIAQRYCGRCHQFHADMPGSYPTYPPELFKRDDNRFVCVCGIVVGDRGQHWSVASMSWICIDQNSRYQPRGSGS
jgi:hypothetical protein